SGLAHVVEFCPMLPRAASSRQAGCRPRAGAAWYLKGPTEQQGSRSHPLYYRHGGDFPPAARSAWRPRHFTPPALLDPRMISLVVPTYNEKANIARLVERAGAALAQCGEEYELIIVDDGSADGTGEEVRRLAADGRPWLRLLERAYERDLSTAVVAGWRIARGDVLGCMDADLQHPPELLPRMLAALR